MKWIRHISTEVRRVQQYRCETFYSGNFLNTFVGMDIDLKLFGLWWVTVIRYNYVCHSWDNDGRIGGKA